MNGCEAANDGEISRSKLPDAGGLHQVPQSVSAQVFEWKAVGQEGFGRVAHEDLAAIGR